MCFACENLSTHWSLQKTVHIAAHVSTTDDNECLKIYKIYKILKIIKKLENHKNLEHSWKISRFQKLQIFIFSIFEKINDFERKKKRTFYDFEKKKLCSILEKKKTILKKKVNISIWFENNIFFEFEKKNVCASLAKTYQPTGVYKTWILQYC